MNVFDFDKTIYNGDSTFDFVKYCYKKYPITWIYLPRQGFAALKYIFKASTKTEMKEQFYSFLKKVPNIDILVDDYWKSHMKNIFKWYLDIKAPDDVIISASPEFLLKPICNELGIKHLFASRVDKVTGKYTGVNCWGEEKVRRFKEAFPDSDIDSFYSDSFSDTPLAEISKQAYIISKGSIIPWNEYKK